MQHLPQSLVEAVRYFSDLSICSAYMRKIKWPDGNCTCPKCGASGDRIGEIATRGMLRCRDCRKQFSVKLDTIFEGSPLGLDKWFVAVWCIANAKNGISSHELGRALDVTQKTAWFMLHRIREAMETGSFRKLDGTAKKATRPKKPEGFAAFDSLAKKLIQVPKAEVDRRIERRKAKRKK